MACRFVREVLPDWNLSHLVEPVSRCAVALAANAVMHAKRSHVSIDLEFKMGVVVLSVWDDRVSELPKLVTPVDAATFGRGSGLALVEALSTEWGFQRVGERKCVFAEFGVQPWR